LGAPRAPLFDFTARQIHSRKNRKYLAVAIANHADLHADANQFGALETLEGAVAFATIGENDPRVAVRLIDRPDRPAQFVMAFNFGHTQVIHVYGQTSRMRRMLRPAKGPAPMRILIADDHKIVRDTLRSLLKKQQPHWEVSEALDGREAVEVFRRTTIDVAVLDIVMDPMGGVAAAYEIKRINPAAKIIFISSHYTVEQASVLSRMLGSGAFVPKSEFGSLLIPTIKRILTESN